MPSATIDTLMIFDRLKKSFTEEQAHTISEIIKEVREENLQTLATKVDLKRELKELEMSLEQRMKELELRLTVRMGAMLAATIAILAAIIKL